MKRRNHSRYCNCNNREFESKLFDIYRTHCHHILHSIERRPLFSSNRVEVEDICEILNSRSLSRDSRASSSVMKDYDIIAIGSSKYELQREWVQSIWELICQRHQRHAFKSNPTLCIFPLNPLCLFSFDQTAFHIAPTSVFARWVWFSKASYRVQFDRRDEKDGSLVANDGHLAVDQGVTRPNNPGLRETRIWWY